MPRILYYDPDPAWREAVLRDFQSEAGAEVLASATFRDAVALARSGAVDAVVADPTEVEVVPFVSAVRQMPGPVPILLFMPRSRALTVIDGMNSGADRFVEKREPARIGVGASEEGGETIYTVSDNGIGFQADQAPDLFGDFTRLHDPREYEGTGIGLPLVRRIIDRHGGRIWAEGEVDRGATFSFTLGPVSD